jgi:hypothetical protein
MSKTQISPLCDNDCDPIDGGDCIFCRDWNRERRDAWVRFAAAELLAGAGYPTKACGDAADAMLAEFDARFGKKEEQK